MAMYPPKGNPVPPEQSSHTADYKPQEQTPAYAGDYKPQEQPPAYGIPVQTAAQAYPAAGIPVSPAPFQTLPQAQPGWTTGIFGCFEDVGSCALTLCCPCVTFGQIAEIVDRGSSSCVMSAALYTCILYFFGCPCLYSCNYRSKLRAQYSLEESPCNDCILHCFLEQCALCQEYRELKNRGFDMNIGYHANVEKRARATTVPPNMQGGMYR